MAPPAVNMSNKPIVTPPLTLEVLRLASLGYFLIPLHSVNACEGCTCGREKCQSKGKHPRTPNGSKNATRDPDTLVDLFDRVYPGSNVGIATGATAGVFALDVDPRHGGEHALAELETEHDLLPTTVSSVTGGGGFHILFRHPGGVVKNSAGLVGSGLDIRGEGGLIVAPPSIHASGRPYKWMYGKSPNQVELADAPAWLLAAAAAARSSSRDAAPAQPRRDHLRDLVKDGMSEGGRNESIVSIAGYLLSHRVDPFVTLHLLQAWNAKRNSPPLDEAEVTAAVNSIAGRELRRQGGSNAR